MIQLRRMGLGIAVGCALMAAALAGARPARAADTLWWVNFSSTGAGAISEANLDGSGSGRNAIDTTGATTSNPEGVAIDPAANRIYWTNIGSPNAISVANLDGTGAATDVGTAGATEALPQALAIDPAANRMYWSNDGSSGPFISAANLDGSGSGVDLYLGNRPDGVAIDPVHNKIYWAEFNSGQLMVANLDGTTATPQPLDTTGATITHPAGIAIDVAANKIYWANDDAGGPSDTSNTIGVANLDGTGSARDLVINGTAGATVCNPQGLAIDPAANRIYWANSCGSLGLANLSDGSGAGLLNTTGAELNGPLFPAILKAPVATGAPAIGGSGTTGSPLGCGTGTWAPDLQGAALYRAPRTFAYAWQLNGTDIPGSNQSSYTPTEPGSYSCRVAASNLAGSTEQTSAALAVVAAPAVSPGETAVVAAPAVSPGTPSAQSPTSVALSGSVTPNGGQTTAVFQIGLDPSYNGGGPLVYTNQVTASPSPVGSDFASHQVSGSATGLVPDALYHVRLVAMNSFGTTFGPDQTFRTPKAAAPGNPALGRSVNLSPLSGHIYVKVSASTSGGTLSSTGPGFVPLTQVRSLPVGSEIDSRFGKFKLTSASGKKGQLFNGTFGGAIVSVSQANKGPNKGLTTFRLLLGQFPGAPNLKGCSAKKASGGPLAQIASLSSAYHSRSRGRYRTRYGRASGSSLGTQWDTIVSCAGVRFKVFHGTVVVNDSARHKTVFVTAGHSYLAKG